MRTLSAFDLDGTLVTKNSSLAFCRFLYGKGYFGPSEFLFVMGAYLRHRFFRTSLYSLHNQAFRALFHGKEFAVLHKLAVEFVETKLPSLLYTPALIRLQREGGVILSNSPALLVEPIAEALGVESAVGSAYAVDNRGRLSAISTVVDGKAKRALLEKLKEKGGFDATLAYSDSFLDLPFLEGATQAIVVRPDRRLASHAKKRGWEVL